jgi:class 3 adenylate cyclase
MSRAGWRPAPLTLSAFIAAFDAPTRAADASGLAAETIATLAPKGDAERRQLTVMFCDLVGSTSLSAGLDPQDLRGIVGAYHRCVAETVEGFSGYVARYMGDGVLRSGAAVSDQFG